MKVRVFLAMAVGGLWGLSAINAGDAVIDPDQIGLSPVSVFEIPAPDVFTYPEEAPGSVGILPRGFPGAPPQVPHAVDRYLPITLSRNRCVGCHDDPDLIGTELAADDPTPMPLSHYVEVDGKLSHSGETMFCTQCHVPQADVPALTGSTF